MSTFSILRYTKSAAIAPKQGEVLSLDVALSNGRQETLEIYIRRYEKRPVFLIPRLGELGVQSGTGNDLALDPRVRFHQSFVEPIRRHLLGIDRRRIRGAPKFNDFLRGKTRVEIAPRLRDRIHAIGLHRPVGQNMFLKHDLPYGLGCTRIPGCRFVHGVSRQRQLQAIPRHAVV